MRQNFFLCPYQWGVSGLRNPTPLPIAPDVGQDIYFYHSLKYHRIEISAVRSPFTSKSRGYGKAHPAHRENFFSALLKVGADARCRSHAAGLALSSFSQIISFLRDATHHHPPDNLILFLSVLSCSVLPHPVPG